MELKDFLKNVISSIANGIIEAQIELSDIGIIINPEKLEIGKSGEKLLRADGWRYTQELDFEILVSIDEKNTEGCDGAPPNGEAPDCLDLFGLGYLQGA